MLVLAVVANTFALMCFYKKGIAQYQTKSMSGQFQKLKPYFT